MSGTLSVSAIQAPDAFATILNDFENVRSYCLQVQTGTSGSAAVSASLVLNLLNSILNLQADWNTFQANAALWSAVVAYAQNVYGNSGITTTTFQNAFNAAGSLLTALETDYPHQTINAKVYLLDRTWGGSPQWVMLTAAQMPNAMPAITAYLATLS